VRRCLLGWGEVNPAHSAGKIQVVSLHTPVYVERSDIPSCTPEGQQGLPTAPATAWLNPANDFFVSF